MAYTVTNNPWSSQYNVGIGIETPCSTLHVFGAGATMRLGPYYSDLDRDYLFFEAGGTNSKIITLNESMTIQNCGGPLILNPNGQCVGIGTTSAPMALTFTDSLGGKILFNNNPNNYSIGLASGVVSADSSMKFMAGCTTPGDFTFYRGSTLSMIIACTGNVGIGTSAPVNALHVCRAAGTSAALALQVGGLYNYFFGNGCCMGIASDSGATGVKFHINRQAPDDAMLITQAGNVGIGTSSPSMILSIKGGKCGDVNEGQGQLLIDGDVAYNAANGSTLCQSGAGSVIVFRGKYDTAGNITGFAGIAGSKENTTDGNYGGNLRFYTRTNGANNPCEWMRITNMGNIGIATSSPSYRLHVNGTFYAAGSSQDYKQGICKYDTDSCMFMKLKPVTYQYKEEFKHLGKELKSQTQIGLIAEEVAEVAPELAILVKENDNDVVRNVDYEKLTILLLSEVQKLRREVDDLKHK